MNDAREALILEGWHDLIGIAHDLMYVNVSKKAARPGVEPGYLLRAGIEFDGDDFPGGFRGLDGGIAQARRRIQHTPGNGRDCRNLPQGILHGVNIFDAVHHKARYQHAGRAFRWHEAAHAVGGLGKHLNRFDGVVLDQEAVDLRFADFLYMLPG